MANPVYWRSPFGAAKRLKISSTQCAIRPGYIGRQQQAGLADVRDEPKEAAQGSEAIQNHIEVVNDLASSEQTITPKPALKTPPMPPGFEHLSNMDPRTKELLYSTPLPPNVQAVYLKPLRRAAPHGIPVCDLQLRSYSVRNLEFFTDFAMRAAYYMGLPAKGPVPLPQITERWTVPRGPFVHKKSQENFERKTLRRLIQIQDGHKDVVQAWLAYLEKRAYYGVGMKANVWEWEDINVAERMDQNVETIKSEAGKMFENFGVHKREGGEDWDSLLENMNQQVRRRPVEIERR